MQMRGIKVCVMVVVLAACAEVTDPNEPLPIAVAVSPACTNCVIGPVTIEKTGSGVVSRTLNFVGDPRELHAVELTWQAPAGSLALVWFNGTKLATINGTGPNAAVRHFVVTVTGQDALRVLLEGATGSKLTVRVLTGFRTRADLTPLFVQYPGGGGSEGVSRDDPPGNTLSTTALVWSQVQTSVAVTFPPFFPVQYFWQDPANGHWHLIGTASFVVFDQGSNRLWRYFVNWDPNAPVPTNALVKVVAAGISANGLRAMTEPMQVDVRP
jgi:hypothetical protein